MLGKSWAGLGGADPGYLELVPRGSKSSKRQLASHHISQDDLNSVLRNEKMHTELAEIEIEGKKFSF